MADDDVFAGLEGLFDEVDAEEVKSVKDMTNIELFETVQDLTEELLAMQQGIKPRTQEARDKHSFRNACQVELRSRGIPV